jgi:hypothetical protein
MAVEVIEIEDIQAEIILKLPKRRGRAIAYRKKTEL